MHGSEKSSEKELARWMNEGGALPHETDDVDQAGEDSFPASDPPPWTPRVRFGPPRQTEHRDEGAQPDANPAGEADAKPAREANAKKLAEASGE